MSSLSLYRREGNLFVPSAQAASPWSKNQQHGGPVLGLIAYAAETHVADPSLQPVRLAADLFRAVPLAPLEARTTTVRRGRRIEVVQVSILGEGREVSRSHALFLRGAPAPGFESDEARIPGPEGLETTSMIPRELWKQIRLGFHTHVEVRWVTSPRDANPIFWVRVPSLLVDDAPWSPFQRAASISDFANAITSVKRMAHVRSQGTFINPDCTLYLSRLPVGEWIRVQCDRLLDHDGIGVGEVIHHDERGRFGRTVQARLSNTHSQVPDAD